MPDRPNATESRRSHRVRFPGGNGFELAGIVDLPTAGPHQFVGDSDTPREEPASKQALSRPAPVVVFSHCFTCNKDLKAIVRLGRALAGEGIAVLRYDMTGLGNSDGDFSQTNFTTNLADLRAAVDFASRQLGPVTGLLGHSFGGAASLAVAGDAGGLPPSLRAVAALAAPSDTQHLAALMARMNPAIQSDGAGEVEIGGRRWTIRQEMLDDFRGHQLERLISNIAVPLMLLHSPVDRTVGFDHAIRIMQLASAGRDDQATTPVSLVALDGADHLLAENPEDLVYVAGLLASFFWRHR
jgi:pimeloyl-ACP methyl ester carboxylesterase